MNKEQLNEILSLHLKWLKGEEGGVSADLSYTDLRGADLSYTDLSYANLCGANLRNSNLRGTNLRGANLRGVDLSCTDLHYTDLRDANLSSAKGIHPFIAAQFSIVPEQGAFEGWKKCQNGVLVRLLIPADSPRSNGTSRKCRAKFVRVLEVIGAGAIGVSEYDPSVTYSVGQTVTSDAWDNDRWVTCSGGIHFYLTRIEAENHL